MIRLLFAGSGEFAIRPLVALLALCEQNPTFELVGLLTQPPRPAGRGQQLTEPPVALYRQGEKRLLGLPLFNPAQLSSEADHILETTRPDLIIVVDYGQFIPERMLSTPKYQCLNIHPSLLPKYRGAIPIPAAILGGESATGVSIQLMAKKMDAGPLLDQTSLAILPEDNAATLAERLSHLASERLAALLPRWVSGEAQPIPQDEGDATYCYEADLSKERARLDWALDRDQIERQIRGYYPDPIAWTEYRGRRLRIIEAKMSPSEPTTPQPLGTLVVEFGHLFVACHDGYLQISTVQPEGKKVMPASAFIQGYRPEAAERLV